MPRGPRRRRALAVAVAVGGLIQLAPSALAQTSEPAFQPYFGEVPFQCRLQQLGTGTAFPEPGADPFCVEYDKTQQNVTDLGVVAFALQEPARVAAAADKCFYFQRDHWTGSIVQGEQPETYHFDGDYFVDRGRGEAGGRVENLRVAGMDPSSLLSLLQLPRGYEPYISSTGDGLIVNGRLRFGAAEPRCAALIATPEGRAKVYGSATAPATPVAAAEGTCEPATGRVRAHSIGPVVLGASRSAVRAALGDPERSVAGFDRFCLVGGGSIRVGYERGASASDDAARVRALMTTAPGYSFAGQRPGTRPRGRASTSRSISIRSTRVRPLGHSAFAGVRGGRVRWLALLEPRIAANRGLARQWLRRALGPLS